MSSWALSRFGMLLGLLLTVQLVLQRVIRKRESGVWTQDTLFTEYPSLVCPQAPLPHGLMVSVLLSSGVTWFFRFILCYSPWSQEAWPSVSAVPNSLWPWGTQNHLFPLTPAELPPESVLLLAWASTLSHTHSPALGKLMGLPLFSDCLGGSSLNLVSQDLLNVPMGLSGKQIPAGTTF